MITSSLSSLFRTLNFGSVLCPMITDCDGFAIDSTTGLFIFYDILNPMVTSVLPLGQAMEIYIRPGFEMDAGKMEEFPSRKKMILTDIFPLS